MTEILYTVQNYLVPHTINEQGDKEFDKQILVGDQLSIDRAVNAIKAVSNGYNEEARLEGLIPAIADWHTGMKILEVIKFLITIHIISDTILLSNVIIQATC